MSAQLGPDEQEQVMALFHCLQTPVGVLLLEAICKEQVTPSMARKALELVREAALHNTDRHAARDALARLDAGAKRCRNCGGMGTVEGQPCSAGCVAGWVQP